MHQHKTVAQTLLILSIFNLVLAAPVLRDIYDARGDVAGTTAVENVAGMSKERHQSRSDGATGSPSSPLPDYDGSTTSPSSPQPLDGPTASSSSPPPPDGPTASSSSPPPPDGSTTSHSPPLLPDGPPPLSTSSLPDRKVSFHELMPRPPV